MHVTETACVSKRDSVGKAKWQKPNQMDGVQLRVEPETVKKKLFIAWEKNGGMTDSEIRMCHETRGVAKVPALQRIILNAFKVEKQFKMPTNYFKCKKNLSLEEIINARDIFKEGFFPTNL